LGELFEPRAASRTPRSCPFTLIFEHDSTARPVLSPLFVIKIFAPSKTLREGVYAWFALLLSSKGKTFETKFKKAELREGKILPGEWP